MNLQGTSTRTRGPAEELRYRLDVAIAHSSGLPGLDELTTEQPFAMVESWRQVARAATLGEHDFDAGLGYGRLSQVQCMTLLKDASDVARGLVGLDRRYSNIPGWQPLKDAGWLGRAAETCATFAGYDEPDYTIDLRGWQPRRTLVEGPGLPGLTGVLQAQHNLLVHLDEFPDARSLRLVLDSQRIVSRDAATLDPRRLGRVDRPRLDLPPPHPRDQRHRRDGRQRRPCRRRSSPRREPYRAVHPRRSGWNRCADSGPLRHLAHLGREIDERITQVIQQGARERIYFARVPFPRVDKDAAGLVKPTRQRYVPMTADVCQELLELVRDELRPEAEAPRAPKRAAASREELAAALVHRPEPRRAQSGPSM